MESAVGLVHEGHSVAITYELDLLNAMKSLQSIWLELPSTVTANCLCHTKLSAHVAHCTSAVGPTDMDAPECIALEAHFASVVLVRAKKGLLNFLNASGEEDCEEELNEEETPVRETKESRSADSPITNGNPSADAERAAPFFALLQEQLSALALTKRILASYSKDSLKAMVAIRNVPASVRQQVSDTSRRSKIAEYSA